MPEPQHVCASLLDHNRAMLARSGPNSPDGAATETDDLRLADACFVTRKGAWGVRLDRWEGKAEPGGDRGAPFEFEGRITIVHLPDGAEVSGQPDQLTTLNRGFTTTRLAKPMLFDFDGDGEPEMFFTSHNHVHEDASTTHTALYTWKRGAVTAYAGLPANVASAEDIDGDGRPDFRYFPFDEARASSCSGFGFRWGGPAFVAHSLADGTFSLDDKVALEANLKACPAPSKGKIQPVRGEACKACPSEDCNLCEGAPTPLEVCAMVHGASEKEARSMLQRICQKPKKREHQCTPPAGVCGDYEDREKALAKIRPAARSVAAPPAKR